MKVARLALMNSDLWLTALGAESDEEDWSKHFTALEHVIEGIPVRVVELTGEPGDVVIGHPWLLHSISPNQGDRPRFMRVQRIRAAG